MFYKEPLAWYAQRSFERPLTVLAVVWAVIFLLTGGGLPQFKQSENSDYDWLIGGALHVTKTDNVSSASAGRRRRGAVPAPTGGGAGSAGVRTFASPRQRKVDGRFPLVPPRKLTSYTN